MGYVSFREGRNYSFKEFIVLGIYSFRNYRIVLGMEWNEFTQVNLSIIFK